MLIPCNEVHTGGMFFIFHHEEKTYVVRVLKVAPQKGDIDGNTALALNFTRHGKELPIDETASITNQFMLELKGLKPSQFDLTAKDTSY